jgi:hypothetical protein
VLVLALLTSLGHAAVDLLTRTDLGGSALIQ